MLDGEEIVQIACNKTCETLGNRTQTFLSSPCFDVCNVFAFFLFPVFVFVWVGNNGSNVKIGCAVVAEAAWV